MTNQENQKLWLHCRLELLLMKFLKYEHSFCAFLNTWKRINLVLWVSQSFFSVNLKGNGFAQTFNIKHLLDSYANPRLRLGFANVSNSPYPCRVYIRLCNHGKRFLLLKQQLLYFCSVIVQISLPSLTLEQDFFSIQHWTTGRLICTMTKE